MHCAVWQKRVGLDIKARRAISGLVIIDMKSLAPLLAMASGALISGCELTPTASASTSAPSGIVGSVLDCEDGYLFVRLPNGESKEFFVEDPNLLDEFLKMKGRSIRVQSQMRAMQMADGSYGVEPWLTGYQLL